MPSKPVKCSTCNRPARYFGFTKEENKTWYCCPRHRTRIMPRIDPVVGLLALPTVKMEDSGRILQK